MPTAVALLARHRVALTIAAVAVVAVAGFVAFRHLIARIHIADIRVAFHALTPTQLLSALALTVLSYLLLTLYDVVALRIVGRPLPYRTAALASFSSYTLSHNLGLALLTGGSARYRVYRAAGLRAGDIARVVGLAGVSFWAGMIATAAIALLVHPPAAVLGPWPVDRVEFRLVGVAMLSALGAGLLLTRGRHARRSAGWTLILPTARQAVALLLIGSADLAAASGALLVLVHGATPAMFPAFFLGYALAIIVALVSHVPGGIGIFESVIVAMVPSVPLPGLVAALLAYRLIYYVLPLVLAAVLLAVNEGLRWRRPIGRALDTTQGITAAIAPPALAALVFIGGIVLLVSGVLPPIAGRLALLRATVPLPFIEASHLAASLVGTALLLLAHGLYRRSATASALTRILLVAGAIFSFVKGVDFEEATVLFSLAALLHWTRASFYRQRDFIADSLRPSSMAAAGVAFILSIGIGLFVYRHAAYQGQLWWRFAWKGDSSRFIRASFAGAVLLVSAIFLRLYRPEAAPADEDAFFDPSPFVAAASRSEAMLALTGDKRFLHVGSAFAMYQIQGRSWIVMGDPVGSASRWAEVLWALRERADRHQGRLLLYQITPSAVPLAIDLGLTLVKYGEEARVDLSTFTLSGRVGKDLRYAGRRVAQAGGHFEILSPLQARDEVEALQAVSDSWLRAKGQSEKRFSVGRFDEAYLSRFPVAIVRVAGQVVAFANIWATADREELSVDMMRHLASSPPGTMDFLFARLMEWGRTEGYRWFSLGVAPLSGLADRRLAPLWSRAGAFVYRHGEPLYGFDGLRAFKQKFRPVWEPRYLAGPSGPGLVRALIDLRALVSGGGGSTPRRPSASASTGPPAVAPENAKTTLPIVPINRG